MGSLHSSINATGQTISMISGKSGDFRRQSSTTDRNLVLVSEKVVFFLPFSGSQPLAKLSLRQVAFVAKLALAKSPTQHVSSFRVQRSRKNPRHCRQTNGDDRESSMLWPTSPHPLFTIEQCLYIS